MFFYRSAEGLNYSFFTIHIQDKKKYTRYALKMLFNALMYIALGLYQGVGR